MSVGDRFPAKHLDAPVVRAGEFILYPYIASQVGLVFVWPWVLSNALSHVALVSEADFFAVQRFRARRGCKDGAIRSYLLAGLVQCRLCGRRMDSHWVNDRAGYRCRHGYSSSQSRPPDAPRNLYVREDVLLSRLVRQLAPDRGRSGADAEPSAVAEIVVRLRAESKVVICGRSGWTIAATE